MKLLVTQLILFVIPIFGFAQLTGKVVNEQNSAVPFASVVIKGTKLGTSTDSSGHFSFALQEKYPFTLVVSSVGFSPEEFVIRNGNTNNVVIQLESLYNTDTVITISRRRREVLQDVPMPVTVLTSKQINESGSFNVNRIKEFVPSVQLYSSNPRNTALNIRGQGTTFGLTNDGIEPGVGFYVDGVYYARPAAATLDFIDVDRIEVLRGPQGTLFGKNTTAGAFVITTLKPSFTPGGNFELSYGNYNYVQAKASITGKILKKVAGRLSFSGTQRNGTIKNIAKDELVNDLNNLGMRGQLLYTPTDKIAITIAGDYSTQHPNGYAQVIAGVVQTLRPAYRQFNAIIADLNYKLPTSNPFDRIIDQNTPWRSDNKLGGASLNADFKLGSGTLTSTTAWRFWKWNSSNDRDYTALSALALSQAPSKQNQWSEELRYAGNISSNISGVVGVFALGQDVKTDPYSTEESGPDQWRFLQSTTSSDWATPGLLDGYGIRTISDLKSFSGAAFGQLDWEVVKKLHVLGGIRYNYDKKKANYSRTTYGGLQTTDSNLIAIKKLVYTNQQFNTNTDNNNVSYLATLSYRASKQVNTYFTFSTAYKSVGINVGGLPTDNGKILTDLAVIKPEHVQHWEAGIKTTPFPGTTLNLTAYNSNIKNYQTLVQTPEPGLNRGYLANAEKVRIQGIEFDGNSRINGNFSVYSAAAYTNGKYISFKNAPVPLEETGGPSAYKDISGEVLPGISKWSVSLGGEFSVPALFMGKPGRFFVAVEGFYRSSFSSSATPSKYLNVPSYILVNARTGIHVNNGLTAFIWGRNIFNKDYFEQLLVASGNTGQYAAVLGDPRTYGITLSYSF